MRSMRLGSAQLRFFDKWNSKGMDKPNPMYIGKIKEKQA